MRPRTTSNSAATTGAELDGVVVGVIAVGAWRTMVATAEADTGGVTMTDCEGSAVASGGALSVVGAATPLALGGATSEGWRVA